jgi:hypothetical protein
MFFCRAMFLSGFPRMTPGAHFLLAMRRAHVRKSDIEHDAIEETKTMDDIDPLNKSERAEKSAGPAHHCVSKRDYLI